MSPELRQSIAHSRAGNYITIIAATIIAFAIMGGVLHLGSGAYSASLMVLTLTVTAFGVLAGGAALDDLENLKSDMTDEIKATGYGAGIQSRDIGKLKMISSSLIGLTGLATVLAIMF